MIHAFCMAGKHAGPICEPSDTNFIEKPRSWREVPARIVNGEWVYDPLSGAKILVCPEHTIKGEPQCN